MARSPLEKIEQKAGMKVLEDVTRLDTLKPRIERFETVEEGLREAREMQREISEVGKYVDSHGFSPGRDFQRVANIPTAVWSAVMEVFGDEWMIADRRQRQDLFYALLAGPLQDYDLRRKPTLT